MKRLKLRHLILLAAMSSPLLCAAAPLVPRIARRIETSEVRSQKLELVYGETVDLEVKFLAYGVTMDIAGAAVTLHARTNGMEEGVSWQASGEAGGDGTATVRIDVDAWLPAGITTGTWTLEVAQTNAVKVLRGGGTLTLSGTGAGLTNAPLPASVASELWAALYGTNTILNAAITNEAALRAAGDAAGLDALAGTNTILRAAITNEAALRAAGDAANAAALEAANAYWPPDATGAQYFTFQTNAQSEIVISGYDILGGQAVHIPEYINRIRVTEIAARAFSDKNIATCTAPSIRKIGEEAFSSEGSQAALTSVRLPLATNLADMVFFGRVGLTSVFFDGDAPAIGSNLYYGIPANRTTNYVLSASAIGWGDTFGGMPVIRGPLSAREVWQDGQLVATTGHVAEAINAIPPPATNYVLAAEKELHWDSYTNVVWRSTFSNGWHWLQAYTNQPWSSQ